MSNADARKFLNLASGDLADAKRMITVQVFRDSSIGFLLQQATEKALKAWIYQRGHRAPFTHDLALLMELVEALSLFVVQLRYDEQPDWEMPAWPGVVHLIERRIEDVESCERIDWDTGAPLALPDWDDWTD